jgi:transcriptional regulator with PAS, ATPase and Fis domain
MNIKTGSVRMKGVIMAAHPSWTSEAPAVNHTVCCEIEDPVSAHVAPDRSQFRSSGFPKLISHSWGQVIGKSPALQAVLAQVERVAPTGSTVLIQGETGTGKELIAQVLHNASVPKREAPGAPISVEEHTSMAPRPRRQSQNPPLQKSSAIPA